MVTPVNIESKNSLARLLATENLWIQHRKVDTASFDLVKRILTFPIWTEMSSELYTMLAGHEVGHALYSEKASVIEIGKRIDPKNPGLAGSYWNIVEDARIERMVKDTYPGLIRQFALAYQDLTKRNFFGIKKVDPNTLAFIDRINLYFKIGHLLSLEFTDIEKYFVNKVENALTSEEVVEIAKEIYEFSKHEHTPPEQLPQWLKDLLQEMLGGDESDDGEDSEGESGEGSGGQSSDDGEGDDSEEGSGSGGEGESSDDKDGKDGSGSGDKDSDGEEKDDKGKGKSGKGKKPKKDPAGDSKKEKKGKEGGSQADGKDEKTGSKTKQAADGKDATEPVDPGPPPDPYTQRTFDEKVKQFNDKKAAPTEYVTLPKPNLDKILVPWQEVHTGIRKHKFTSNEYEHRNLTSKQKEELEAKLWEDAESSYLEFRKAHIPKINYIFQQFMMKKQADRYKRTRQHKTGSLDPLRLHAYKIDEDLFKTVAIVSDDKNHGLIFVVDWSDSMSSSMAGTVEQLIMLCMFCQKAGIPFEVYSLTTGSRGSFDVKEGDLVYADNFRMRCYLSSRMTSRQFNEACVNLFMLMPDGRFKGGPTADNLIGCTPLDESIITTIDLMTKFRRQTGAQIVNAIFMTDGGANTVSGYRGKGGQTIYMDTSTRYLIDDRFTHKVYAFERYRMTPTMLQILRDRQDINVVGFYIGGSWEGFFENLSDAEQDKLKKQWKEEGFVIATAWGYSELYITKSGEKWRVKDMALEPKKLELGTEEYDEKLGENFTKKLQTSMKQRVMLDRFVKMIASKE